MKKFTKSISVVGINTGLGVSLYPLRDYVLANLEERGVYHTPKNEQWQANFPGRVLLKKKHELPELKHFNVDVVISTPDCGSGSMLRFSRAKVGGDHKKNSSLKTFFESIELLKPKLFLFENLQALFKTFPREEFEEMVSNYKLVVHNVPVSKFGNSQIHRKRLVIVGIRKDLPYKEIRRCFKLPKEEKITLKTSFELYSDLLEENVSTGHVRELSSDVISIFARKRLSIEKIKLEWQTRLSEKSRWITDAGEKFSSAPGVYRNLKDKHPATARKANRQFDHNGDMLTPRQLARIMGVPDSFKLHLDLGRRNYWINKTRTTITKGMVYEIGTWFKKGLLKSQAIWNN